LSVICAVQLVGVQRVFAARRRIYGRIEFNSLVSSASENGAISREFVLDTLSAAPGGSAGAVIFPAAPEANPPA